MTCTWYEGPSTICARLRKTCNASCPLQKVNEQAGNCNCNVQMHPRVQQCLPTCRMPRCGSRCVGSCRRTRRVPPGGSPRPCWCPLLLLLLLPLLLLRTVLLLPQALGTLSALGGRRLALRLRTFLLRVRRRGGSNCLPIGSGRSLCVPPPASLAAGVATCESQMSQNWLLLDREGACNACTLYGSASPL